MAPGINRTGKKWHLVTMDACRILTVLFALGKKRQGGKYVICLCHICFDKVFLNLTFIIDYNVTFVLIRFFKFDFYHRLQCHICFDKVFLNLTFIIDYNVTFVLIRFSKFDFYHRLQCHICFDKVF